MKLLSERRPEELGLDCDDDELGSFGTASRAMELVSEKRPEAFSLDCGGDELVSFDPPSRSGMELVSEKRHGTFCLPCVEDELALNEGACQREGFASGCRPDEFALCCAELESGRRGRTTSCTGFGLTCVEFASEKEGGAFGCTRFDVRGVEFASEQVCGAFGCCGLVISCVAFASDNRLGVFAFSERVDSFAPRGVELAAERPGCPDCFDSAADCAVCAGTAFRRTGGLCGAGLSTEFGADRRDRLAFGAPDDLACKERFNAAAIILDFGIANVGAKGLFTPPADFDLLFSAAGLRINEDRLGTAVFQRLFLLHSSMKASKDSILSPLLYLKCVKTYRLFDCPKFARIIFVRAASRFHFATKKAINRSSTRGLEAALAGGGALAFLGNAATEEGTAAFESDRETWLRPEFIAAFTAAFAFRWAKSGLAAKILELPIVRARCKAFPPEDFALDG